MITNAQSQISLPRTAPELQGVSSQSILNFIDAIESENRELHSFMLLRHGSVVAEGWWHPYQSQRPHMLYSLSKSFTASAVGMAVHEGRLSVEDKIVSFFSEDLPADPSEHLLNMEVKHLLSMATGHETEPNLGASSGTWVQGFLAHPVENQPGTKFLYNTPATYMLAAIVEKLTGESLLDYLSPRLFVPLGITDPTWEKSPQGICTGGYGLSIRTEDIAKFGQLYLQRGNWNGQQLIEADWVAAASSVQVSNGTDPNSEWAQGYGYQFWRCLHDAYRGDGAFGQYCVVMPGQDAVIAITAGLGDMQAVLTLCWKHLLGGMSDQVLKPEAAVHRQLAERLAGVEISVPSAVSPAQSAVEHLVGKVFQFSENEYAWRSLEVALKPEAVNFALTTESGSHSVNAGFGAWVTGTTDLWPGGSISARAVWSAADTLTIRIAHVETPYINTYSVKLNGQSLEVLRSLSASFGPTEFGPVSASQKSG